MIRSIRLLGKQLSVRIAKDGINFDYVKTRLNSIALASYYGYDSRQFPLNINKAELSALKKLSKNRDIILRPVEENGVVILTKVDHINKVESLLSDASKFKKLDCGSMLDLCAKRENKLIRFLRDKLLKGESISEPIYKELLYTGSTPGILCGLP